MQKETARLSDKAEKDKHEYLLQVERLKTELKERFQSEIAGKTQEQMRSENLFADRISILEKEVSRLEVQLLQAKQIESDLRDKNEVLRVRND